MSWCEGDWSSFVGTDLDPHVFPRCGTKAVRVFKSPEESVTHFVQHRIQKVNFWDVGSLSMRDLRRACNAMAIDTSGMLEKTEFQLALRERRNAECPICYDTFNTGEKVSVTLCGHWFHTECLVKHACSAVERTPGEMPGCVLGCGPLNKRSAHSVGMERANEAAKDNAKRPRIA